MIYETNTVSLLKLTSIKYSISFSNQKKHYANKQKKSYANKLKKALCQTKKKYYANLNHKEIPDNKQFCRTVKPLVSDKSKSNEKITLAEDNKIISEDKGNAELLNGFFSNAVKNLEIPKFSDSNPLAENIPHPIFKAILKYKNHASIIAIKNARNGPGFYFCGVSVNDVFKDIKILKARKATQTTDIAVKILKENADIFSAYICFFLSEAIRSGKF